MTLKTHRSSLTLLITLSTLWVSQAVFAVQAADGQPSPAERQKQLIAVLKSEAPPQEKAVTCKHLAVYGTEEAVPFLAPLLTDPQLASWARIALEAIPHPSADEALRNALGKVQDNLLIGVINSIGVRRDAKAIEPLGEQLKAANVEVASAAAEALGKIGGEVAAKILERSLGSAAPGLRSSVAEGCILCAERCLADGKSTEAARLYDIVRSANVPLQRRLEGIRGAILARGAAGLPLLLEHLRAAEPPLFGIGLRTARELAGREVTEALAKELERCPADRQPSLLMAIGDRTDDAVMPTVLGVAKSGAKKLRLAAVGILDRRGDVAAVPTLLEVAAEGDKDLTPVSKMAIARMENASLDADLLKRLESSSGKMREVLIDLAGQRRIDRAVPSIMNYADDTDAATRRAAFASLGLMGGEKEIDALVRLLGRTQESRDREDIEKALISIGSRVGSRSVPHLLPLARHQDVALRGVALQVLASLGGNDALTAVRTAVDDKDESIQDEAVRILAGWPNNWPDDVGVAEPLLALAKSGRKLSHQVQGMRGYLQYLQEDKKLKDTDRLGKINDVLPLMKRPEEKRLAISVLGGMPTAEVLELLTTLAGDSEVTEEACQAIVKVAGNDKLTSGSKELRQKALRVAQEKTKTEATRQKAGELLK